MRAVLERAPLYTWYAVSLPAHVHQLFPTALLRRCEQCGGHRNFRIPDNELSAMQYGDSVGIKPAIYTRSYVCADCAAGAAWYAIYVEPKAQRVRKVGQWPAQSIEIDAELTKSLDSIDADLFRRATISMSQGFGIGACAYLRRVLEHQLDPLLRLVREVRAYEKADESELQEIDAALERRDGDTRTRVLYKYAPASLVVDGENPFKLLYEDLSDGIHAQTEDEATRLAVQWHTALAFVVTRLVRDRDSRRAFVDTIRAGRATRSE